MRASDKFVDSRERIATELLTVPRRDSESRKPLKSLLEAERHEHRAREEAAIDLATNCTHDDMSEVPSDDRD